MELVCHGFYRMNPPPEVCGEESGKKGEDGIRELDDKGRKKIR